MNEQKNKKLNNEVEVERGDGYEFYFFPKKGIVVCKLTNCQYIAVNRILKYGLMPTQKEIIHDVFTGVAKCAPEDTYNKEFGRKLALTKAKAARGKAINKAINIYMEDINKKLKNLYIYGKHDIPHVSRVYVEEFIKNNEPKG